MADVQSIADAGTVEDLSRFDPLHILELGKEAPDVLLRWVYQNLLEPPEELDPDWVAAIHRGAMRSSHKRIDPEFSLSLQLRRYPVDVESFIFGDHFLRKERREIYPEVLKELKQINNPEGLRIVNPYTEGVFTGGIGSAKSTTALYTTAYQLYVLSCFDNPHATFGLDSASEIVFVFLAVAGDAANTDYTRFYHMLKDSPYFNLEFPYNKRLESEMHFPHRIQVLPHINTIGQNVMGGMIDEVNFGQIIQSSKRSVDGGVYDQARTVYTGLARRRKSRFMSDGSMPGILCLVSSKRYPGEFTDKKLEEARSDPTIYVYDKRVWDVKPAGTYSGVTFKIFPGSAGSKPCIVDNELKFTQKERDQMVDVPVEYRKEFEEDIIGSLRDIAGISTLARHPFFQNVNAVTACFGSVPSIFNVQETDMVSSALEYYPSRFKNLNRDRWVHVDLGQVADAAGVSCGYVDQFVMTDSDIGLMPRVVLDFVLRITPPHNGEIQFHKIRKLLVQLRSSGLPIKWVSFDAFQSVDSIQMLRSLQFFTGRQSVDQNASFYSVLKTAMYSGRVVSPVHETAKLEILRLEKDPKTGKIDHPPSGSKDCADSMAGVVYGLTMRRDIWNAHGVPFTQIYNSVKEVQVSNDSNL